MAMPNMKEGIKEMVRSFSKQSFLKACAPHTRTNRKDIVPTHAGVRAQAILSNGNMVDDFCIIPGINSHICNAPSPQRQV